MAQNAELGASKFLRRCAPGGARFGVRQLVSSPEGAPQITEANFTEVQVGGGRVATSAPRTSDKIPYLRRGPRVNGVPTRLFGSRCGTFARWAVRCRESFIRNPLPYLLVSSRRQRRPARIEGLQFDSSIGDPSRNEGYEMAIRSFRSGSPPMNAIPAAFSATGSEQSSRGRAQLWAYLYVGSASLGRGPTTATETQRS
jgi:hypothetical protein